MTKSLIDQTMPEGRKNEGGKMTTTKERLKEMLTSKGMFETQADAVLEEAIPKIESLVSDYKFTWDRPAEEYPDTLYVLIWIIISEVALEWIDKNIPLAWFRPMFEKNQKTG